MRSTGDGEWFCQQQGGKRLGRLPPATELLGGESQGDWQAVTLEGWIFLPSVGATARAGFDLEVTRAPEENLRAAPGGPLVAKLPQGFALTRVAEERRWVHVRRAGWMARGSLEPVAPDSGLAGAASPGLRPGDSSPTPTDSTRAQPARRTALYRAPEGPQAGMIAASTPMRVLSRSGDWTRVQFEGWVKTADLAAAPAGGVGGGGAAQPRPHPPRPGGATGRLAAPVTPLRQTDQPPP